MEVKNLSQPLNGVFFNKKEDTATFSLKYCGKDEYIETIRALLDMLGRIEHEFCFRDMRYHICNLISSMLPDESQIINLGDPENQLLVEYNKLQDSYISTLKTVGQQNKTIQELNELINKLKEENKRLKSPSRVYDNM